MLVNLKILSWKICPCKDFEINLALTQKCMTWHNVAFSVDCDALHITFEPQIKVANMPATDPSGASIADIASRLNLCAVHDHGPKRWQVLKIIET